MVEIRRGDKVFETVYNSVRRVGIGLREVGGVGCVDQWHVWWSSVASRATAESVRTFGRRTA